MSKTARGPDPSANDHDQGQEAVLDGIPLGTYREENRVILPMYDPGRDVVRVADPRMSTPTTVSRHTWAARSHADPIDRAARQRRALLQAGELLD